MIEQQSYGTAATGVRIGDGSLYDFFVEEIASIEEGEETVAELESAMALLKELRQRRRFAGVAEAAFDEVLREQATKRRRPRKRRQR